MLRKKSTTNYFLTLSFIIILGCSKNSDNPIEPKIPQSTTPKLISPKNNATEVSIWPNFSWNLVAIAKGYDLQISLDDTFSKLIYNEPAISDTTKQMLNSLSCNTTYYWRVRFKYEVSNSNWSDIWKFSTYDHPLFQEMNKVSIIVHAQHTEKIGDTNITKYDYLIPEHYPIGWSGPMQIKFINENEFYYSSLVVFNFFKYELYIHGTISSDFKILEDIWSTEKTRSGYGAQSPEPWDESFTELNIEKLPYSRDTIDYSFKMIGTTTQNYIKKILFVHSVRTESRGPIDTWQYTSSVYNDSSYVLVKFYR